MPRNGSVSRRRRIPLALLAISLALAVGAVAAPMSSARGLKLGFGDAGTFQSPDPSVRSTWFNRAAAEGAKVVRISVFWRAVAQSKPAHPANPADPAYDFSAVDASVRAAHARHLDVMFTVEDAPDWAEGKNRPPGDAVPPGAWKPNPNAFGRFAQALGKRYSGHYDGLPRVSQYEVWNEPNITKFLAPQWQGKHATSPDLYRNLLNAFYKGVKKSQHGAKVIAGAMSPFGDARTDPLDPSRPRLRPLVFLRKLLCLKNNLKPSKCPTKPHFDILSQHPLNFNKPPRYRPYNPNDVQVATFGKVKRTLRAAERAKHVRPGGHRPLWATEYIWYTNPPNPTGVSPMTQARWIEFGFYLLWKEGASVVLNYPLRDEPRDPTQPPGRWGTSGTFYYNGSRKPSFQSFRFPFVGDRTSKKKVRIWSKAPTSGRLKIQRAHGKGWRTVKRVHVHRGEVVTPTIRLRSKAKLRGEVGGTTSLVWNQR